MKAIIFDVDGVITDSAERKMEIIKNILQDYHLYDVPGVREILAKSLNRVLLLQKIHEVISFDKEKVLDAINREMDVLEDHPQMNTQVVDFIKNNYKKYLLFTNTSLPHSSLERIIKAIGIGDCFQKLLAGEDGTKAENIFRIIGEYGMKPEEILFIDDTLSHIENVQETGVHTLHFTDFDIDIGKRIQNIH